MSSSIFLLVRNYFISFEEKMCERSTFLWVCMKFFLNQNLLNFQLNFNDCLDASEALTRKNSSKKSN